MRSTTRDSNGWRVAGLGADVKAGDSRGVVPGLARVTGEGEGLSEVFLRDRPGYEPLFPRFGASARPPEVGVIRFNCFDFA